MERNNTILHLLDEVKRLTEDISCLKERVKENEKLREELQMSNGIINQMVGIINDLTQKIDVLEEEKKYLFNRIEQLKHRVCDEDCVLCVIVKICKTEKLGLGVNLCCRQLDKIITLYANPQIILEDLKCVQFMDILKKCEIVAKYDEYKYPPEMIGRFDEMVKAWNTLMTMDDSLRVVIIGRVISEANGNGHAELFDLDTRTSRTADGMVMIQDAQKEMWRQAGQQDFINHVKNDEGVIFYIVNFEKLKQIINDCSHILHLKTSDQTLPTAASTIYGVQ